MKRFDGFPFRTQFTPIPNLFFSSLLAQINDITELKVTLYILAMLYQKRGYPRFTTYNEMLSNSDLMESLSGTAKAPQEMLRHGLELALKRGTILHMVIDKDGNSEDIYLLNTEKDKQAIARIESGELQLPGAKIQKPVYMETEEKSDIFSLFEQNIGILTPMIAEELREAEKLYPENWLRDAIKEAVTHGKRKWSYISAILEHWSTEGKSDGTYKGDSKKTDPDKYIKGKWGNIVRR